MMFLFIEITIFIFLAGMVGYICFFSFMGRLLKPREYALSRVPHEGTYRIVILVPAYREDAIILSTARNLLKQNYPVECFSIYIIADSLKEETILNLQELPIHVISVHFEKSTKVKALNTAMDQIDDSYDIAVVCDADNILQPDFLLQVASAFDRGHLAMQGQRVAKNMDSSFSVLDGASEIINNHIFRKGHSALGLSSSVIGSGMAFSYSLLKETLAEIKAIGGFDKVLQLAIVKKNIKIAYLEKALIFDEKIPHAQAFGTQRRRWLSSQFIYLKEFFIPGFKMLFKGNINYFNLSVMHNLILPRVILLGILPLLTFISLLLRDVLFIGPMGWTMLCFFYFISLLIALPKAFFSRQFLPALLSLPKAFLIMLKGILRIKGANQSFIHTAHHKQEITNPMFKVNDN